MHLDPITGLWKSDGNDYQPPSVKSNDNVAVSLESCPEDEPYIVPVDQIDWEGRAMPEKPLNGRCVLSIRFLNEDDYKKWAERFPGRKWEFLVSYPAIMRAEYKFHNSLEVEAIAKKIVDILQMGFNVNSANWVLEEEKICGKTGESL